MFVCDCVCECVWVCLRLSTSWVGHQTRYHPVFQQSACFLVFSEAKLECLKHIKCVYVFSAHIHTHTLYSHTLFLCVLRCNGGVNKHEFVLSCFLPSRQLLSYTTSTAVLSAAAQQSQTWWWHGHYGMFFSFLFEYYHLLTFQFVFQTSF